MRMHLRLLALLLTLCMLCASAVACGANPPAETTVEKLSSVKIISADSFATSVPLIPIAQPISAFLSAGASFTPSPVIATT